MHLSYALVFHSYVTDIPCRTTTTKKKESEKKQVTPKTQSKVKRSSVFQNSLGLECFCSLPALILFY